MKTATNSRRSLFPTGTYLSGISTHGVVCRQPNRKWQRTVTPRFKGKRQIADENNLTCLMLFREFAI